MRETIITNVSGENAFFSLTVLLGPDTHKILEKVFQEEISPYAIQEVSLYDPRTRKKIEKVKVIYLPANTYEFWTDIAFIIGLGGRLMPSVIEAVFARAGARIAAPYEIIKHRYLDGQLDLLMAHGFFDMIGAHTLKGFVLAKRRYEGELSRKLLSIVEDLKEIVKIVEEGKDRESALKKLKGVIGRLRFIYSQGVRGMVYIKGLEVAIVGRPNVGKSTLFNRLVGKERSIVTHIPGTTRDVVSEEIELDGVALKFHDTAGFRETQEFVERIGVERAKEMAELSHFILFVMDASVGLTPDDIKLWKMLKGERIVVLNKIDMAKDIESFEELEDFDKYPRVYVSGKTGEGFNDLIKAIREEIQKYFYLSEELALTKREGQGVKYSIGLLEEIKNKFNELSEVMLKARLENVIHVLEAIIGVRDRSEREFTNALKDVLQEW